MGYQAKWNCLVLIVLMTSVTGRWTQEEAQSWYKKYPWSAGFNYAPSYAVNEIQMWMSFNQTIIDQELRWASEIGFSKLRVFLHVAPYFISRDSFLSKIERFLKIAKNHNHNVIPVLFDDCWNKNWSFFSQPDPIPGVHNSQWVQCPGESKLDEYELQEYVMGVMKHFQNDTTIVMWDLYNQVGNSGKKQKSLPLLKKIFQWARESQTSQPLTSGHWNPQIQFKQINQFILSESDIITFHAYCDVLCTKQAIARMKDHKRPVICTEYMARPLQSKFITHLPVFKEEDVWAINWGFVYGRTQTYYPWWSKQGDPVPKIWFHDVVHPNGDPFDPKETQFIKQITSQAQINDY